MSELLEVLSAIASADADANMVLATVVHVQGSSYRRPGARMLIGARRMGAVSGGCLEADVLEHAGQLPAGPVARLLTYDTADENAWGLGMGCNGTIRILLQRLPAGEPARGLYAWLFEALQRRTPCVLATAYETTDDGPLKAGWQAAVAADGPSTAFSAEAGAVLAAARRQLESRSSAHARLEVAFGKADFFLEYIPPSPALLIVGAGDDAVPLAAAAQAVGWQTTIVDRRGAYATAERFPGARVFACPVSELTTHVKLDPYYFAVVMTHHFADDAAALQQLLPLGLPYVGLLGPRQRTERLLAELAARRAAFTPEQLAALHAPVGLDLGAETPAEIAAAIVAEMLAARYGRAGTALRLRNHPIHPPVPVAPGTTGVIENSFAD